jgi:hypothetical protein
MSTRIHTKIAKTIAATLVIEAVVAPGTSAAGPSKGTRITIPQSLARLQEPGSTGYVPKTTQVTIPSRLANLHEPGSTGYVPKTMLATTTAPVGGGLDWISALIGAGVGLGIAAAGGGVLMALRKRRTLAHV